MKLTTIFKFFIISSFILIFLVFSKSVSAIYDPLSVPNNKVGVHILFPTELGKAKELVNSSGGDWGYVTIPIQAGDKDLRKWQKFFDDAKSMHLIPIIRLATEGNYFQKESWSKPSEGDIIDFANFLNSLDWPTKNRYVIVFNEVNRADEWQGEANPQEYAKLLSFASNIFKSKNGDFFIISSGMDNAAVTGNGTFSQYEFFRLMHEAVPEVFSQIDGFASHSYPNPAFTEPPSIKTRQSASSFIFEKNLINTFTNRNLPVFITETGWDQGAVGEEKTAEYFKNAYDNVWNTSDVVAITPFILHAGPGPFEKFSLLKSDGSKNAAFKTIENIKKDPGQPILSNATRLTSAKISDLPVKNFSQNSEDNSGKELKYFIKWLLVPL